MNTNQQIKHLRSIADELENGKTLQAKHRGTWKDRCEASDLFYRLNEYRVKPEPIESWANVYETETKYYYHEGRARNEAGDNAISIAVHMREVPEE